MQRLILLRHAKAERTASSGDDFDRALSERGKRDARLMDMCWRSRAPRPDRGVGLAGAAHARNLGRGGPSVRRGRGSFRDDLYHATASLMRRLIEADEGRDGTVMIVGHNPGLHQLAVDLLVEGAAQRNLQSPKCARAFRPRRRWCTSSTPPQGPVSTASILPPTTAAGAGSERVRPRRAALRALDPEEAHTLAIAGLEAGPGAARAARRTVRSWPRTYAGLTLPTASAWPPASTRTPRFPTPCWRPGFGFVECGTVTPLAQAGNPRPRLFRLSEDGAVINRMGFNNQGLEAFAAPPGRRAARARAWSAPTSAPTRTPTTASATMSTGLKRLWGLADYFTLNVSSPNTPGLRALQAARGAGRAARAGSREARTRADRRSAATGLPEGRARPGAGRDRGIVEAGRRPRHRRHDRRQHHPRAPGDALARRIASEAGGLSGAPLIALSTECCGSSTRRRAAASP